LAFALVASPSSAAWIEGRSRDPLTHRIDSYATLTARAGVPVKIFIGCRDGQIFPEIHFLARVGFRQRATTYHFDNGSVIPRLAPLCDDCERVFLWDGEAADATAAIRRAKRLHMRIEKASFEFDLAGAEKVVRGIKCKQSLQTALQRAQ
jgi:hypothetical protein